MDDKRFDQITRALGGVTGRRQAVKSMFGGAVAAGLGAVGVAAAEAKGKKSKKGKGKKGGAPRSAPSCTPPNISMCQINPGNTHVICDSGCKGHAQQGDCSCTGDVNCDHPTQPCTPGSTCLKACSDTGGSCNLGSGDCSATCVVNGASCQRSNQCCSGLTCQNGKCQGCGNGPACKSGETCCGGKCVTCPTGGVCSDTTCSCPHNKTLCGTACIDTQTDNNNCGGCGHKCNPDQTCQGGHCVNACTEATCKTDDCMRCVGNDCVSRCTGTDVCSSGKCCPKGQTNCGGTCIDVHDSDPANCGGCGVKCPAEEPICSGGVCTAQTCDPNTCQHCSDDVPCNLPVAEGKGRARTTRGALSQGICCSGACVNPKTDKAHCGHCATHCGDGQTCQDGTCAGGTCGGTTCAGSTPDCCGEHCTNVKSDKNNCGHCDNKCGDGQICRNGVCTGQKCGGQDDPCNANEPCCGGFVCDKSTLTCRPSLSCNPACDKNVCQYCNNLTGACISACGDNTTCDGSGHCIGNGGGTCDATHCNPNNCLICNEAGDCVPTCVTGETCDGNGNCLPAGCTSDDQCEGGICLEGICFLTSTCPAGESNLTCCYNAVKKACRHSGGGQGGHGSGGHPCRHKGKKRCRKNFGNT